MKKFAILILLLFMCSLVSQAQKDYSQENLDKLSQEELDIYLNKALKLQKWGLPVTIVGVAALGGLAITAFSTGGLILGFAVIPLAAITVGISMYTIGKKRVKKINTIKNPAFNDIAFDLKPCAQYNQMTQNYQPGLTLRISF